MKTSDKTSIVAELKKYAGAAVLIITAGLFFYYIINHPQQIRELRDVGIGALLAILFLYIIFLFTNAFILFWSIQFCHKSINKLEVFLLNSYSTLANFFGPLQSGPGVRAIYLKKKHGISIKSYGISTLIYYASFGAISLLMLCYGFQPLFAGLAFIIILSGTVVVGFNLSRKHPEFNYHPLQVTKIICLTAFQIAIIVVIYFIELRSVNKTISLSQALIYTGAANLALFVSLTPGAIGFRESFLLLSERLHQINPHDVLAASVIDRGIYFLFLGLLFVFTAVFHVRDELKINNSFNN